MMSVSVIVPVYKVESYLARCVESLLAQTYKGLEIILVDDGSPDNCGKMCDAYAERYSHVRVVHKENGGLSSARLAGFLQAQSDYVLFIDSDDYVKEEMVGTMISAIEETGADMAVCSYLFNDGESIQEKIIPFASRVINAGDIPAGYMRRLIGHDANEPSIPAFLWLRMMRRSLIRPEFFVDENRYFSEDIVFDLEYASAIKSMVTVPEALYVHCLNSASLSNKYRSNSWEMSVNLYHYLQEYEKTHQLQIPEVRKSHFVLGAVNRALRNAVCAGSYGIFRQTASKIAHSPLVAEVLKSSNMPEVKRFQALNLALLRARLYGVMYGVQKARMLLRSFSTAKEPW